MIAVTDKARKNKLKSRCACQLNWEIMPPQLQGILGYRSKSPNTMYKLKLSSKNADKQ